MSRPNLFHDNQWSVNFSNIPTVSNMRNMAYYDGYVKSCTIPNYNIVSTEISFKGSSTFQSLSKKNENPELLQISFKLSESGTNYLNLFEFMQEVKYGQNVESDLMKENIIDRINVGFLDNQKRIVGYLYFNNALLINLSSLNLERGTNNEITFSTSFIYEQMRWESN